MTQTLLVAQWNRSFLLLVDSEGRKRWWRMASFSLMIFLFLNCDRLPLAPELDSFSDSPFLDPKGSPNHCGL